MLELHKSNAGAKTQAEIDVREAGRQIKSVDGAIDGLVYELYGLSEEEISIVESLGLRAGQMLELHKSKAGAKTQAEMDVYERQIKSVDGAIDNLVYELSPKFVPA